MTKLTLVIRDAADAAERRVPIEGGLTIGRHPQCGCVLQDGTVSATHARIVDVGGTLLIEDLGGTNPTRVNGETLAEGQTSPLVHGMELTLGQTRIQVEGEAPPVADPTPEASPAGDETVVGGQETVVGDAAPPADPDATVVGGGAPAPAPAQSVPPPPPPPAPAAPQAPAAPAPAAPAQAPAAPAQAPAAPAQAPAAPAPIPAAPARAAAARDGVQAAPVPDSRQDVNVSDLADQTLGTLVYGGEAFDPNDPNQVVALRASLSKMRPRLVFANEVDRRIVEIGDASILVGRSSGADCRIEHPAVSSKHASIAFDTTSNRFFVEDLGGRNKTLLNGEQLAQNAPHEIPPESLLEFGPIKALFVVDVDALNRPMPAGRYEAALEVLARDGKIQPHQRSQAVDDAARAGRHVGESLLLFEIVTIEDWREAYREGEILIRTGLRKKGLDDQKRKLLIAGAVAVVLIAILLIVLL